MKLIAAQLAWPAVFALASTATTFQSSTIRVSVSSSGAQGNNASGNTNHSFNGSPISADNRFVAFDSWASNLVVGDTNGQTDVFVHDLTSGTTERVSVDSGGTEGNNFSGSPSISLDGRYVAFYSYASNLVTGDTNGFDDVFVHDRTSGTTVRVSIDSGGAQANGHSGNSGGPSISANGRFVAFESSASNLVAGDTNGQTDVFVHDRNNGMTERVNVDSAGAQANHSSWDNSISADGRFVTFQSSASNLVVPDTNGADDAFVHDRTSGMTMRVSVDSAGGQGNGNSYEPHISADGRFVAFGSSASNLVAGDTNGQTDVFVRDLTSGTTTLVSVATGGAQGNSGSIDASISADGRFVAFWSAASNLVAGDTNTDFDVFVHDRSGGKTERESVDSVGAQANSDSYYPSISADGRFVAFTSYASNLVAGDTNMFDDVFLRDRGPQAPSVYCTSGTTSHGCIASIGATANPSISLASACSITVTNVEGQKPGILFYGADNANFSPGPWASGSTSWLCVKAPTQRTPIQNSGGTFGACDGSFVLDWNAYQSTHPLALGSPWIVGDKVYAQACFRDPLAVKSTNLSDAVEMTYGP